MRLHGGCFPSGRGDCFYCVAGALVARYCLKKFTGKGADDHYSRVSPIDGQVHRVEPEFALMSRRPGLGTTWFEKFASDAFPSDFLIVDGRKVRPPGFYLRKLDEAAQQPIKRSRKRFGSAGATCEQQQGAPGCARRDLQFAPEASGQDAVIWCVVT